jgi:hypothetical protein
MRAPKTCTRPAAINAPLPDVDGSLGGAELADLPVAQSTRFLFAINRQTAKRLAIGLPSPLLAVTGAVVAWAFYDRQSLAIRRLLQ